MVNEERLNSHPAQTVCKLLLVVAAVAAAAALGLQTKSNWCPLHFRRSPAIQKLLFDLDFVS